MIRKILFENVCRLCGQEKQNGVNVLNGPRGNELLSKINTRLSKEIVHFYPEDGLPKFVCSDCEVIVNSFSEFCNMVLSVQQKLEVISNSCEETSECLEQRTLGCTASVSISAGGCITCLLCGTSLGNNPECATLHLVGHGIASPFFVCRICGSSGEGIGNLVRVVGDTMLENRDWNPCRACNSHIESARGNGTGGLKTVTQMQNTIQNVGSLAVQGHLEVHRGAMRQSTRDGESRKRKKTRSTTIGKEGNSHSQGGCDTARNFTCEVCARTFASRAHLSRHRLVHSGARPFHCDSCPAAFSQRGSLQVHLLQHSGTAPYPCPHCPRAFRFKVSLRSHILNIHPGENVSGIGADVATLNEGESPNPHSRGPMANGIMPNNRQSCKNTTDESACPGRGSRPSSDHGCDRCGKRFATAYKLGRHYRSHTGERPFECRDCGRRFSQTGNLNLHRKTHHIQQHLQRDDSDSTGEKTIGSQGESMERALGVDCHSGGEGTTSACGESARETFRDDHQVGIQGFVEMEGSLGFGTMEVEKGVLGDGREGTNDCILSVGDFEEGIAQSLLGEPATNVVRHHSDLSLMPSPLSCTTPTISAMDKVLSGQTLSQIMEGEGLVDKVFSKLGADGEGGVVYHSEGLLGEEEGFPGMGSLEGRQFGEYVGDVGSGEEGGGLLFLVEEEGLGTPLPAFPSLQTPPPMPHT